MEKIIVIICLLFSSFSFGEDAYKQTPAALKKMDQTHLEWLTARTSQAKLNFNKSKSKTAKLKVVDLLKKDVSNHYEFSKFEMLEKTGITYLALINLYLPSIPIAEDFDPRKCKSYTAEFQRATNKLAEEKLDPYAAMSLAFLKKICP